eukprot:3074515-Alexandrium_andersonii.AAC.1
MHAYRHRWMMAAMVVGAAIVSVGLLRVRNDGRVEACVVCWLCTWPALCADGRPATAGRWQL